MLASSGVYSFSNSFDWSLSIQIIESNISLEYKCQNTQSAEKCTELIFRKQCWNEPSGLLQHGGRCLLRPERADQSEELGFFCWGRALKRQALTQSVQTEGVYIGAAALTQYETNNKTMNLKMSIQMCDTELISHLLLAMRSFVCWLQYKSTQHIHTDVYTYSVCLSSCPAAALKAQTAAHLRQIQTGGIALQHQLNHMLARTPSWFQATRG